MNEFRLQMREENADLWQTVKEGMGVVILLVALVMLIHQLWNASQPFFAIVGYNDKQQLVWEHTNYDGTITVYCDIPSMDRLYVVKGQPPVVEKQGCQGLP